MDGALSQEEINALLNNPGLTSLQDEMEGQLTEEEKDAIGEIGNISMGTAATALASLLNNKVDISTPVVSFATWTDICDAYERPCVFIRIAYTVGLDGSNILVLRENDVKIITDLMMGGDGTNISDMEVGELHLSAISEAMNMMMGSAATSLSGMFHRTIDISPPMANLIDLKENIDESDIDEFLSGVFVKISFRMEIGDLVDSEIMQLYPISFAKEMYTNVTEAMMGTSSAPVDKPTPPPVPQADQQIAFTMDTEVSAMNPQIMNPQMMNPQMMNPQMMNPQMMNPQMMNPQMMNPQMMNPQMMNPQMMNPQMMNPQMMSQPINVQQAQFQAFTGTSPMISSQENIGLIMDVPLEVTVELGRTSKSIEEILAFTPGTILELNRIAGEPIDILVNGKYVAKGEVVVIEESFGVRITEIIK